MFKKIFFIALAVLISCSALVLAFAQTKRSPAEENTAANGSEGHSADTAPLSSGIVTEESGIMNDPAYLFTASADPEYLEWLLAVPDEIKCASTGELLGYFLESPFMGQQLYSSSTFEVREIDFSCHEAFRELVSREDCIEVLEQYAGSFLNDSEYNEPDLAKFEKLLAQPSVRSLLSDLPAAAESCPNLQRIYTRSEAAASPSGDQAGALNGIR